MLSTAGHLVLSPTMDCLGWRCAQQHLWAVRAACRESHRTPHGGELLTLKFSPHLAYLRPLQNWRMDDVAQGNPPPNEPGEGHKRGVRAALGGTPPKPPTSRPRRNCFSSVNDAECQPASSGQHGNRCVHDRVFCLFWVVCPALLLWREPISTLFRSGIAQRRICDHQHDGIL